MYSMARMQDMRVELTKRLDKAIRTNDPHAKEDTIAAYCDERGLKIAPLSDTSLLLFEPGNVYALRCDVELPLRRRMLVYTLQLPEPIE